MKWTSQDTNEAFANERRLIKEHSIYNSAWRHYAGGFYADKSNTNRKDPWNRDFVNQYDVFDKVNFDFQRAPDGDPSFWNGTTTVMGLKVRLIIFDR